MNKKLLAILAAPALTVTGMFVATPALADPVSAETESEICGDHQGSDEWDVEADTLYRAACAGT